MVGPLSENPTLVLKSKDLCSKGFRDLSVPCFYHSELGFHDLVGTASGAAAALLLADAGVVVTCACGAVTCGRGGYHSEVLVLVFSKVVMPLVM